MLLWLLLFVDYGYFSFVVVVVSGVGLVVGLIMVVLLLWFVYLYVVGCEGELIVFYWCLM